MCRPWFRVIVRGLDLWYCSGCFTVGPRPTSMHGRTGGASSPSSPLHSPPTEAQFKMYRERKGVWQVSGCRRFSTKKAGCR